MRVAVLGSWKPTRNSKSGPSWPLLESLDAFQAASRAVGRELARRGHSLVVGSEAEHTADRHAALGALDAVFDGTAPAFDSPRIMIVRKSADGPMVFREERVANPGVFVEHPVDAGSEGAAKQFQVRLSDALLLLGGAEHTEEAGLAAAACNKPLACIGSFGGAARGLNRRFVQAPDYWGYERGQSTKLRQVQEPFSDVVLKTAFELAWIQDAPKLMLIHGRSPDRDRLKEHLVKTGRHVVVLADCFAPSEPIPDKFERYASSVDGAIALVTPDDFGGLTGGDAEETGPRARQNVWIEVGWFWGRLGRGKLLLLVKGKLEIPSDIGNVEHCTYTDDPMACDEQIQEFIAQLRLGSDS